MALNRIASKFAFAARRFGTTAVRRSEHDTSGIAGSTLPFGLENRLLLVFMYTTYCATGLALPFYCLRYNLLK